VKKFFLYTVTLLALTLNTALAESADSGHGWNEAGVRVGWQAGPKNEYFHLYEAFAVYGLPWDWRISSEWKLAPQLNAALGALHTAAATGLIGTIGTGLTLHYTELNLVPEVGITASFMDERHYGRQNFGSTTLLGAYLGLAYQFDSGLAIGYRLLHLSNGHIFYSQNTPNPGVDLHLISTSWHF